MLRDIEKENLAIGMYIRVLIRLFDKNDMKALLSALDGQDFYIKRVKYKEKIDKKTILLIYYAPNTYQVGRVQDFLKLLDRIHQYLEKSSGYLIDFMTTNKGNLDYSMIGSKYYVNGKLTNDYYRVFDSLLTTLTYYSQDAFEAAEKYKFLREFLPNF